MNARSAPPPITAPEPVTGQLNPPKFRLPILFWIGLVFLVIGTGPLLGIIVMAKLGLTHDPNPNPVGFGMLAGLTFWPSVGLIIAGIVQGRSRYRRAQSPCP